MLKTYSRSIQNAKSVEQRFWEKIDKQSDDECWKWLGAPDKNGYGIFRGFKKRFNSSRVHRIIYELYYGIFPNELDVCHTCDNPPCCNPKHLFLGTNLDNTRDKVNKNRQLKGEKIIHCKLKDEEILEIKRLWKTGKFKQQILGKMFGVTYQNIHCIVKGKSWKWLN